MSSPTIGVQSIRRAFAVLRVLGSGPLGVSDVAIASRIPKSTAARLLAALTGEAAGVSIRDGWTVQYVDQVEPPNPNPIQVRDWTGTRIPLHAVSSGQVFLAQLPAPTLSRYLADPLDRFTPRTRTDAP